MALRKVDLATQVDKVRGLLEAGKVPSPDKPTKRPPSEAVQLRWPSDDLDRVKRHFDEMGLTLSAGIRLAVREHMRRR